MRARKRTLDKEAANLDIEDPTSLVAILYRTCLRVVGRLKHIADEEAPLQLAPFIEEGRESDCCSSLAHDFY